MSLLSTIESILQMFGDATPGIERAIEFQNQKRKLDLGEREQNIRETYMNKLIERMSAASAERYFENQNQSKNMLRNRLTTLIPMAASEEFRSPGSGKQKINEFLGSVDLDPFDSFLFPAFVWHSFNDTYSKLSGDTRKPWERTYDFNSLFTPSATTQPGSGPI